MIFGFRGHVSPFSSSSATKSNWWFGLGGLTLQTNDLTARVSIWQMSIVETTHGLSNEHCWFNLWKKSFESHPNGPNGPNLTRCSIQDLQKQVASKGDDSDSDDDDVADASDEPVAPITSAGRNSGHSAGRSSSQENETGSLGKGDDFSWLMMWALVMMSLSLRWRDWGSFLGAESEFDCVKIGRFGFLFDDFSIAVHL